MTQRRDLSAWRGVDFDAAPQLVGRYARLERLSLTHAEALFSANGTDPALWRFMGHGPFPSFAAYRGWVAMAAASEDPLYYAIGSDMGWCGVASYLRLAPQNGVLEIGAIVLSPDLQRTPAATEGLHLMLAQAFDAGFRRVEWKCDALNAPSCRAAERLGFRPEGIFRQHMVVKGANRDTAWFAMLDSAWPTIAAAHRAWLEPGNFDDDGTQRHPLSTFLKPTGSTLRRQ